MRTDLVLDALRMALGTRQPGADFTLVTHTDQGSQYVSDNYTQVLADHMLLASVGSVGDAFDNALAESFVDSFKTELIKDRVCRPAHNSSSPSLNTSTGSTTAACTNHSTTGHRQRSKPNGRPSKTAPRTKRCRLGPPPQPNSTRGWPPVSPAERLNHYQPPKTY
jgi:transposase InsO family protein